MTTRSGLDRKKNAAATARKADRDQLEKLRRRITTAKARRRTAFGRASALCKRARLSVARQVKAYRAKERARINEEVGRLRTEAQTKCRRRKASIMSSGRTLESRNKEALAEQRRVNAMVKRWEREAAGKHKKATSATERRQQGVQAVLNNLPSELHAVFRRVKGQIAGTARKTRTEAFLDWVDANPEEVFEIQHGGLDAEISKMVRKQEKIERRLAKASGSTTQSSRAAVGVPWANQF